MTTTLNSRLQDTVSHLTEIAPAELLAVFSGEQKRLAAQDSAAGRIAVGEQLPTATLTDPFGAAVPVPGDGPAVIVFYRGAWCPYCNVALAAYQREVLPHATERGVRFVAISPQGPDGSLTIAEKNELSFSVLTDVGGAYAARIGIAFDLDDDVKQAQLAFGNDFTAINAGGEWSLPKPAVLVIDSAGIVRFLDVRPDYTERTEPAAIIAAIDALPS